MYLPVVIIIITCTSFCRSAAILYPIKAHTLLSKRRITIAVSSIWLLSTVCALPTAIYNDVMISRKSPHSYCRPNLPKAFLMAYQYTEFAVFFAIPLIIQITLYILISRRLNESAKALQHDTKQQTNNNGTLTYGLKETSSKSNKTLASQSLNETPRKNNAVESRKRVVRMLTACMMVYMISYTPAQVSLFYETFAKKPFAETWFLKSVLYTLGFINASANPIIYCIYSESYRTKFAVMYRCVKENELRAKRFRHQLDSTLTKSVGSMRTLSTAAKTDGNAELQPLNRKEEEEVENCIDEETVRLFK